MGKLIFCSEMGMDCKWVARAETEEELLKKVAEHASIEHGINELTEELVKKARKVMCNE